MALLSGATRSSKVGDPELPEDEGDGHTGGIFERGRDFESVGDAHS